MTFTAVYYYNCSLFNCLQGALFQHLFCHSGGADLRMEDDVGTSAA